MMNANPDIVPELLQQGEKILIAAPQPLISVETTETITVTERIGYQTVERNDNTLYKGTRKTLTKGVSGKKDVVYRVTKINNTVTERVAHQDVASLNELTIGTLGAQALGVGVTAVLGRAAALLVGEELKTNTNHDTDHPFLRV